MISFSTLYSIVHTMQYTGSILQYTPYSHSIQCIACSSASHVLPRFTESTPTELPVASVQKMLIPKCLKLGFSGESIIHCVSSIHSA